MSELTTLAGETVQGYLSDAVKIIDQQFGTGYAKSRPELVAQFLTACSIDCVGMALVQSLDELKIEVGNISGTIYHT
jgi:hypothetical protein